MPGRQFVGTGYKYGFNGQEKDDEVAGAGSVNTAEYWEYDSRIGRRWNKDPIVKPWESSYACFANNPIYFSDILGLTPTDPPKIGYVDPETGNTWSKDGWVLPDINIEDEGPKGEHGPKTSELPKGEEPPLAAPSGGTTPIPSPTEVPITRDYFGEIADDIRAWESRRLNGHERSFGPPVPTTFYGFYSFRDGGSSGESMSSPNAGTWADGNPGEGIYNMLKTDPRITDKLLESIIDYADKAEFYAKGDPLGPLLGNLNSEQTLEIPAQAQQQAMGNDQDSIIEKYQLNGRNTKVKKPLTPDDNNHVNGIIQDGPRKGQTEKLINNNW